MEDADVGELWQKYKAFRWDDEDGKFQYGCAAINLIRKLVEERTLHIAGGLRSTDENWAYCTGLALEDFGIDPKTWIKE